MFDRTKLLNIGGGVLPRSWQYSSSDDITTNGYFPAESRIQSGDKLTHVVYDRDNATYNTTSYFVDKDDDGILSVQEIPGGAPNLEELSVTPSVNAQSIFPEEGYDGFSLVNVSAVTSSIDPNITASNIVNGVEILGVTGTAQTGDFVGITRAVTNGVFGYPSEPFTYTYPNNATDVAENTYMYAFRFCNSITSANFHSLKNVSGNGAFSYAFYNSSLISVDFSLLTNITANGPFFQTFYGSNLTEISLSSLTNIAANGLTQICNTARYLTSFKMPMLANVTTYGACQSICYQCYNLTTVNFSSLANVSGQRAFQSAFTYCTNLTEVSFPKLFYLGSYTLFQSFFRCYNLINVSFPNLAYLYDHSLDTAFSECVNLPNISFPNLSSISGTTALVNAFNGCTNLTEIHFPAAVQTQIQSQTGYSTKWGATNATIYFDL